MSLLQLLLPHPLLLISRDCGGSGSGSCQGVGGGEETAVQLQELSVPQTVRKHLYPKGDTLTCGSNYIYI